MSRQPVALTTRGRQLLGVLHLPDGVAAAVPGVVFLHGFAATRVEPHRMFVKAAEELAARGLASLRFDFSGCGDSEGDFRDVTVPGQVAEAAAALAWLAGRPEVDPQRLGAVGFSLGAAVAALLAGSGAPLQAVALWAPLADFAQYEDLGYVARLQGQVDLQGDVIGRGFFRGLDELDPAAALAGGTGAPVLVACGTGDETLPHSERYVRVLGPGRARLHTVEKANHTFDAAHWEQELLAVTADWLAGRIGSAKADDEAAGRDGR